MHGKMVTYAGLVLTLLFSAADGFFGFGFYVRWNKYELFGKDALDYSFTHSLFEFCLFSMVRVFLLLSAAVGILVNSQESVQCIKKARYPIGVLNIFLVLYTFAKIMLYTEYLDGNHDDDVWFLTLGAWTMVASLAMYVLWVNILQEARSPLNGKECSKDFDTVALINKGDRDMDNENNDSSSDDDDDGGNKMKNKKKWYSVFTRLITYSKQDWPFWVVGLIALIGATICKTFIPLLAGQVLDGVIKGKDTARFHESMFLMGLISCVVALCGGVQSGCHSVAIASLNRRITNHLFDSIHKQDIAFFDKNGTGAILSRLISDTTTMSDSLGNSVKKILSKIFQIVSNTVAMVVLSRRLSVITVITFVLLAVITDIVGKYFEKLSRKIQSALADANIVAEKIVSNMKTVRSFAIEAGEKSTYRNRLDTVYNVRKKEAVVLGLSKVMVSVCELLSFVMALFYGGHLVLNDKISGGMLFSFVWYQQKIGGNIVTITDGFAHLMKAAGASRKVFEMIDLSPAFRNEGRLAPKEFEGHLEFKNVTFAYPTRPSTPVLRNISFTASPGEVLALVGPSGGGKSSCISLIEHLYEPTSGEILIDGVNVKDYDHTYLHTKIALVGQEPVLYAKTIKDNISYSLEGCNMARIHDAVKQANAHHFILDLQKGYATDIGEKGVALSRGQKQRVAIARALVRNPQMLLMDRATSALDAESEHLIQQAVFERFRSRTVVIVGNRLRTIEKADRILVIDHGMVVEQGSHRELISSNGLYARLVRRQLQDSAK